MNRFFILTLLFSAYASTQAAELEMQLDRKSVPLGLPVEITIRSLTPDIQLSELDVSAWEKDFIVRDRHSSSYVTSQSSGDTGGIRREELRLRLYAKRSGDFYLEALRLGKHHTPQIQLNVVDTDPSGLQLRIISPPGKTHSLVRQQIPISIQVLTNRNINVSAENWSHENTYITSQPVIRTRDPHDSLSYKHTFNWKLMALKPGRLSLTLPYLSAGGRRLFTTGELEIDVGGLPAYLPTYIPVGQVSLIDSSVSTRQWKDQPSTWRVQLNAAGLSEEGLQNIIRPQLRNMHFIRFYPPQIRSISEKIVLEVPFAPLSPGEYSLPSLTIPFINPDTEKLEQLEVTGKTIDVIHPFWHRFRTGALFLAIAVASLAILYWLYANTRCQLAWRQWRKLLLNCDHAADFLRQLISPPRWTGLPRAITVGRWLRALTGSQSLLRLEREPLANNLHLLEALVYANRAGSQDFRSLKLTLVARLPQRKICWHRLSD